MTCSLHGKTINWSTQACLNMVENGQVKSLLEGICLSCEGIMSNTADITELKIPLKNASVNSKIRRKRKYLCRRQPNHTKQVLSDVRDKERHPGRPYWGLGVGLISSYRKNSVVSKPRQLRGYGPKAGRSAVKE